MPRIFYMPRTRSSRVLWALYEIGAAFDATRIAPEERRSAEHLARQPLGRVPALELDDGTMMFESAAILLALGDLHPQSGLLPGIGTPQRALVYQWMFFGMTELEATLYRSMREPAEALPENREFRRFTDAATAFSNALGEGPWILGAKFTLADIVCVGVLGSADSRGLLAVWPGLSDYVARGEARPAYAAAVSFGE
ncbi:MAG TPA: glutathione S-transferase family protein [Solirubrobacteraceae bacterium]|nr:glutathione S-transferase family protein [Solirubrobacteraceae bacterium]